MSKAWSDNVGEKNLVAKNEWSGDRSVPDAWIFYHSLGATHS
jgi:hypothetical protein